MNLQKQLRRLEMLAGDRDTRGVTESLAELGRNDGWSGDVENFIERMGSSQRAFVQKVIDSQQPAFDDIPGPGDQQGGNVSHGQYWNSTSMAGVTQDATSGIYVPATAGEWTTTMAAAGIGSGNPASLYLMQEAAGNLADSIGALTLTAGGTGLGYQAAVTGWTRKGVTFTDAGSGHFTVAAGTGPNPATTSVLWCGYVDLTAAPAATRDILSAGGVAAATQICAQLTSTSKLRGKDLAVPADGLADSVAAAVIPVVCQLNRTGSVALIASAVDKTLPTYGGTETDGSKGFGATQLTSAAMSMVYGFMFSGASAELTATQIKTLLQTLGWTVTWS